MYERFLEIKELWIISLKALALVVAASYIILKIITPKEDFFKTKNNKDMKA